MYVCACAVYMHVHMPVHVCMDGYSGWDWERVPGSMDRIPIPVDPDKSNMALTCVPSRVESHHPCLLHPGEGPVHQRLQ